MPKDENRYVREQRYAKERREADMGGAASGGVSSSNGRRLIGGLLFGAGALLTFATIGGQIPGIVMMAAGGSIVAGPDIVQGFKKIKNIIFNKFKGKAASSEVTGLTEQQGITKAPTQVIESNEQQLPQQGVVMRQKQPLSSTKESSDALPPSPETVMHEELKAQSAVPEEYKQKHIKELIKQFNNKALVSPDTKNNKVVPPASTPTVSTRNGGRMPN